MFSFKLMPIWRKQKKALHEDWIFEHRDSHWLGNGIPQI